MVVAGASVAVKLELSLWCLGVSRRGGLRGS